jgi:hypothetical protein
MPINVSSDTTLYRPVLYRYGRFVSTLLISINAGTWSCKEYGIFHRNVGSDLPGAVESSCSGSAWSARSF